MNKVATFSLLLICLIGLLAPLPLTPSVIAIQNDHSNNTRSQVRAGIRKAKRPVPNSYLVIFKDDVRTEDVSAAADKLLREHGGTVRHHYKHAVKGFSAQLSEQAALALTKNPLVDSVEEDARWSPSEVQTAPPHWGLDRIDQRDSTLDGKYSYTTTGLGVHAYVVDSGLNFSHPEFTGRAIFETEVAPKNPTGGWDCHGHGTSVAGVLGGTRYGVAKQVTLHIVRVASDPATEHDLSDRTRCSEDAFTSDLVMGLEWVYYRHLKPAVVNFSWNADDPTAYIYNSQYQRYAIEVAVINLINAGVTFVNSAGNRNTYAYNYLPANMPEAIVVGSTVFKDGRHWTSNYGLTVDVFAPGYELNTPDITSGDAVRVVTGTSFAAPHVAGVVARYLQTNPLATPAQVQDYIINTATPNKVTGIPDFTYTPNRLLYAQP